MLAAGAAYTMKQKNQKQPGVHFSSGGGRHVYLQDSSLSSLAVAAYLIRDYNFDGANIHIFDGKQLPGGSCSYGVKGAVSQHSVPEPKGCQRQRRDRQLQPHASDPLHAADPAPAGRGDRPW